MNKKPNLRAALHLRAALRSAHSQIRYMEIAVDMKDASALQTADMHLEYAIQQCGLYMDDLRGTLTMPALQMTDALRQWAALHIAALHFSAVKLAGLYIGHLELSALYEGVQMPNAPQRMLRESALKLRYSLQLALLQLQAALKLPEQTK